MSKYRTESASDLVNEVAKTMERVSILERVPQAGSGGGGSASVVGYDEIIINQSTDIGEVDTTDNENFGNLFRGGADEVVGPTVSVNIGGSGRCLVIMNAYSESLGALHSAVMGVQITGPTNVSPDNGKSLYSFNGSAGAGTTEMSQVFSGLAQGAYTFTAKYHSDGSSVYFWTRRLIVMPL